MRTYKLNPIQRILLTTNGSVTNVLEAITNDKIKIETLEQKVVNADRRIFELLKIEEGDVNYREVVLKSDKVVLAYAVSYTPLKRLKKEFKDDLMRADVPIGKIISRHSLEVRREINWTEIESAGKKLSEIFGIKVGEAILSRNYNIINNGEILINITEYFPAKRFE